MTTGSRSLPSSACLAASYFFNINVGMGAFLEEDSSDTEEQPITRKPSGKFRGRLWLMVSGVTVLIALLEKTQGLARVH